MATTPKPFPACLPPGFTLHQFDTIDSTNDEAARLALSGAASGTIVLADRQTCGRGRLGRPWQSRPGNLHASILLRPRCTLKEASQLSLLAGLVLVDLLIEHGPQDRSPQLKWPNDVLIDGAKVAGILLESAAGRGGTLAHVVIGLGLDIVWFPDDVAYPVTSIEAAGWPERTPKDWLIAYAVLLSIWLDRWQREGFAVIRDAWMTRSYGLGGSIRLRLDREEIDARFVDLTEEGALLVEHADGTRQALTAGDVVYADR